MKGMHRTLLRVWLVIWVVTLPLVHIHPEVDHAHGMSDHVHGGTYHSILVNTPVHAHQGYEQEEHHHDGFFSPGGESGPPSHPLHGFEEATYGFSLIKPSIVLESEKLQYSHDLVFAAHAELLNLPSALNAGFTPSKSRFSILLKALSPRAPPISST